MNTFRATLARHQRDDEGISLIEVMVAMIIFSIVALGVIATLLQTANFAIDSRARETATNLAAQAIDSARSTTNVFNLFNSTTSTTSGGHTYTVKTVAQWYSDATQVAPCGGGGGALLYKQVNVTVTWPGMVHPNAPVRADTLIAPSTRVSDPADATMLVSVEDQGSNGVSGVTVTTSPALSPPAKATDVDGCSYLLKVPVGSYTVTVSKAGYVGTLQQTSQSVVQQVTAGTSVSIPFTMDAGVALTLNYASNSPGAALPSPMYVSLLHATDPAIDASTLVPLTVYPFPDGYSFVAGHFIPKNSGTNGCLSPNPTLWPTTTVSGITYAAPSSLPVVPSVAGTVQLPMGIVQVKGTANSQPVSAVLQATGPSGTADPGCSSVTATYNFGKILSSGKITTLALPYGSYKLFYSTTGTGTQVTSTNLTVTAPSTIVSNVVTLDPRTAQ
ncbi:MAG TPA: type II secretion system protein [Galbitalea sp.]|nr:type II secretion system protein [Galbitalea sp.]